MRAVSLVALGWCFLAKLAGRALLPGRGRRRFEQSHGPGRLVPLEREEQETLASLSRCVACGLCDAHFGSYDSVARTTMRAPSDVVLAHSRSLDEWNARALSFAQLERGDLARIERLCPAQIPLARVVEVAKKKAGARHAVERAAAPPDARALPRGKHDPG